MDAIEDVLQDEFAYRYLLHYSQKEHSEEYILLLKAVSQFQAGKGKDDFLKDCLASVTLPAELLHALRDWMAKSNGAQDGRPPAACLDEAYRSCYRVAKFDIFPRFWQSEYSREMIMLHLSNMLPRADFQHAFYPSLSRTQHNLATFWIDTSRWGDDYWCALGGAPSKETIERGKQIWEQHQSLLSTSFESTELVAILKQNLFDPSRALFYSAQVHALNQLHSAYAKFLDSSAGIAYLNKIGMSRLPVPADPPAPMMKAGSNSNDDYSSEW